MPKETDRTPIMVPKKTTYRKFMKKKGDYISKTGKNISNHKFLEILLERAKI